MAINMFTEPERIMDEQHRISTKREKIKVPIGAEEYHNRIEKYTRGNKQQIR